MKDVHAVMFLSCPPSQCSFLHVWGIRCNSQLLKQAFLYPSPPEEWGFCSFSRMGQISLKILVRGTCPYLLAANTTSTWFWALMRKCLSFSPWSACTGNPQALAESPQFSLRPQLLACLRRYLDGFSIWLCMSHCIKSNLLNLSFKGCLSPPPRFPQPNFTIYPTSHYFLAPAKFFPVLVCMLQPPCFPSSVQDKLQRTNFASPC